MGTDQKTCKYCGPGEFDTDECGLHTIVGDVISVLSAKVISVVLTELKRDHGLRREWESIDEPIQHVIIRECQQHVRAAIIKSKKGSL